MIKAILIFLLWSTAMAENKVSQIIRLRKQAIPKSTSRAEKLRLYPKIYKLMQQLSQQEWEHPIVKSLDKFFTNTTGGKWYAKQAERPATPRSSGATSDKKGSTSWQRIQDKNPSRYNLGNNLEKYNLKEVFENSSLSKLSDEEQDTFWKIMVRESKGHADAEGDEYEIYKNKKGRHVYDKSKPAPPKKHSYGLFQIRGVNLDDLKKEGLDIENYEDLKDPATNMEAAYHLYKIAQRSKGQGHNGFKPWGNILGGAIAKKGQTSSYRQQYSLLPNSADYNLARKYGLLKKSDEESREKYGTAPRFDLDPKHESYEEFLQWKDPEHKTPHPEGIAPPESVEIIKELRKLKHVNYSSPLEQKQHKASLYDTLRTLDPKGFKAKRGWHKFHKNWKPFLQKGPQFDEGDFEEFKEQEKVVKTPSAPPLASPLAPPSAPKYPGMGEWEGEIAEGVDIDASAAGGVGGFRAKGDPSRTRVEEQIDLMEQNPAGGEMFAEASEEEFGDVEASEQLVADVNVDPATGKRVRTIDLPQDISSETEEYVEEKDKYGYTPSQTNRPGYISPYIERPPEDKDVPPPKPFQPKQVIPPEDRPAGQGVLPSQDPDVLQDFSYEEKDEFARNLSNNPDQIEEMGEFELSESLNKIPPIRYKSWGMQDRWSGLRANLSDKLGKIVRHKREFPQTPEAVGIRETASIIKEPESDLSSLTAESPEKGAQDFIQKANDLLQNEMERYKSKEFELSKIDPKRFWNNTTTNQKIWGAIGVMLGAIGGAMAGQPNHAANMIQKMIDADIDSQKDSNENKRLMKNEAYRRVTMAIGNLERAETRKFQKDKIGLLKQELGMKLMGLQQTAQKGVLGKVFGAAAFQKGGIPVQTWNIIRQQNPDLAKRLQDMAVVIGNKVQFALNKDLAKTLNSTIKDMRLAGKSIQRLGDLSDDINWGEQAFKFWNAGKIEEARAHARGLIGVMRESVVGGGVMTEQDRKLIESLIPNPDKFFRLGATDRARLKFLFNKANDNIGGAMKSAGISVPVEQNIKVNKANIKQHLRSAGLDATPENIKKSIKILKKNRLWKAQSPLKYLLQG